MAIPGTLNTGDLYDAGCEHSERVAHKIALVTDGEIYRRLALLFGVLADSTRVKMVHALLQGELCSCELAAVAGVTKSGASQHLRLLRALGLVRARRQGKYVFYSLDDDHVAEIVRVGFDHLGHRLRDSRAEELAPVMRALA